MHLERHEHVCTLLWGNMKALLICSFQNNRSVSFVLWSYENNNLIATVNTMKCGNNLWRHVLKTHWNMWGVTNVLNSCKQADQIFKTKGRDYDRRKDHWYNRELKLNSVSCSALFSTPGGIHGAYEFHCTCRTILYELSCAVNLVWLHIFVIFQYFNIIWVTVMSQNVSFKWLN